MPSLRSIFAAIRRPLLASVFRTSKVAEQLPATEGVATVVEGAAMQPSSEKAEGKKAPADKQAMRASVGSDAARAVTTATSAAPEEDMARLMEASDQEWRTLRRGEMLEGVVVSIDRDGGLVDGGTKSEGVVSSSEVQGLLHADQLNVGDTVYVVVVQPEGRSEHAILSLSRARSERGWVTAQTAFDAGTILHAKVVETNRGGVVADLEGVRGFVPLGQIASVRVSGVAPGADLDALLSELIGRELTVKVLEGSRKRNRLILSERLAAQELRGQRKEQLLAELHEGERRRGRVTSLADFGAFVDLGGADGLVHLSELAWHQVGHPSEVVSVGDEGEVVVLGAHRERRTVSCSLPRTQSAR